MHYLRDISTRQTPQSEPLPGQDPNNAGGHAWTVSPWERLQRFLILGSEGGTYYVGERDLTKQNVDALGQCLGLDGVKAVGLIEEVSTAGRAPKNDPAIFALAYAMATGNVDTRRAAEKALINVCRTGTHLFHFAAYMEQFRGWGRIARRAVAGWYAQDVERLAYQMVKYRQRDGWSHRDLLRLSHPEPATPEHDALFRWCAQGEIDKGSAVLIDQYRMAQAAETPAVTARLLAEMPSLPREALNPDHLTAPAVWEQLLENGMPITALLRNLPTLTRLGLLDPMGKQTGQVTAQLCDSERLIKGRVHPLSVLVALRTYAGGFSIRGSATWTPTPEIIDALDAAFYMAFKAVEPAGKRTYLALDVSGSMGWSNIAGLSGVSPRVGSMAMALITAAVEPQHYIAGFQSSLVPLNVTPRTRLDDACRAVDNLPFGRTDCAAPMLDALDRGLEVDTFIVYTDSETWAGGVHPSQALQMYRERTGIPAKLIVIGMVSNGFSIADPTDPGMLDVVGFDTATPNVISGFARSGLKFELPFLIAAANSSGS